MMTRVVAENDVVITTAAIPGKKAPILVTAEMVRGMKPGSVVVDLAAERGGNCELTRAGETVIENDVKILGPANLPSDVPYHASQMYSKNLTNFMSLLVKEGNLQLDSDDEIIRAIMITRDGKVISREN
jgi:NAD(P) transhydrogenase subunit alpha